MSFSKTLKILKFQGRAWEILDRINVQDLVREFISVTPERKALEFQSLHKVKCWLLFRIYDTVCHILPTFHYWLYPVWLCMWQIIKNLEEPCVLVNYCYAMQNICIIFISLSGCYLFMCYHHNLKNSRGVCRMCPIPLSLLHGLV